MQSRCFIIVIASLFLTQTTLRAEPVILESRIVHIARIIGNLQKAIAADPGNVALRINLAREPVTVLRVVNSESSACTLTSPS